MDGTVYPVILSGGAGTRLWPMSRALFPKQLLDLASDRSMLRETADRLTGDGFAAPMVICNQDHRFIIAEQLRELLAGPRRLVLEPVGRNTAPAATAAALLLAEEDPDAVMMLLPSDHVIRDTARFHAAVATGLAAARDGALVTFGIPPAAPETGYGYIRRGAPWDRLDGCFRVDRFVEKPDRETAQGYLSSGDYDWNSGMFIFPVRRFLDEMAHHKPDILEACRRSVAAAREDLDFLRLGTDEFAACESVSIDYAVMEKADNTAVVPIDMGWSDVGSWSALWDIGAKDADGNVCQGDVIAHDTRNNYLRGEGKLIAAIGIEDLVVVATDDVVLVVPRERAQEVRGIVEELKKTGRSEHYVHTRVFRPWGNYQEIDSGGRFQVKQIVVNPGAKLSLQMHYHRAEHWVVVSGTARVTRGDETFYLHEDQSTYIPLNVRHSLENPGKIPLRLIEVQSGAYLGEDDIVRFDDRYGRAPAAENP